MKKKKRKETKYPKHPPKIEIGPLINSNWMTKCILNPISFLPFVIEKRHGTACEKSSIRIERNVIKILNIILKFKKKRQFLPRSFSFEKRKNKVTNEGERLSLTHRGGPPH